MEVTPNNVAIESRVVCVRCERPMDPLNPYGRTCPSAPDHGPCEPLNAPTWEFGDPVRQGATIHVGHCERSDLSIWLPPDIPCTCHLTPIIASESSDG